MFYGQVAVAGAFGGLLSWAVFKHFPDQDLPADLNGMQHTTKPFRFRSWQILFLIEGLSTVLIAFVGFFWLPHSAGTAWFLTPEERVHAETRIHNDRAKNAVNDSIEDDENEAVKIDGNDDEDVVSRQNSTASHDSHNPYEEAHHLLESSNDRASIHSVTDDRGLSSNDIISAFTDWKIWYILVCNVLSAIPATAFSVFLPIVVKGLVRSESDVGETAELPPATANLLTVPPFLAGAVVLWSFTAWSDLKHERLRPVLWGLVILLSGLTATVLLPHKAYVPRYLALIVLLAGSFVPSPLTVAWLSNNTLEPGKRAVVLGINGWGNLAGVLSALLFAPRYRSSGYILPFFVTLACVGVSFFGFLGFRAAIVAANKARAELLSNWEPERKAREAKYGDVYVTLTSRNWMERLRGTGSPRRGEDRLTYQFAL